MKVHFVPKKNSNVLNSLTLKIDVNKLTLSAIFLTKFLKLNEAIVANLIGLKGL